MKATELFANQLQLVHTRVAGLADITPRQWLSAPGPGENPIGFTAWHIVATRDWTIRAMLQAKPPLGWSRPFAGTGIAVCQLPFGMPATEAEAVARVTSPAEVIAYSAAVTDEILRWLGTIDEAALAVPFPAAREHLALSPRYNEAAYRHELEENPADMCLWPVWALLTRPAFSHCIGHLTEISMTLDAVS